MTKVKPLSTLQLLEATINCIPELNFLSPSKVWYRYSKFMKTNPLVTKSNQVWTLWLSKLYQYIPAPPTVSLILHYSWISSHLMTIFGTFLYSFSVFGINHNYYQFLSYQIDVVFCWYCLSVLGSILAYTLVLYHHCLIVVNTSNLISTKKLQSSLIDNNIQGDDNDNDKDNDITLITILNSENAPLLGMALLTLFTPINLFKLFPSTIYAMLNIFSYILVELYPTTKLFDLTFPLFVIIEHKLLLAAANIELFNLFIYFTLSVFNKTYAYSTILYLMLICLKIQNSYYSYLAIKYLIKGSTYLSRWMDYSLDSMTFSSDPDIKIEDSKDDIEDIDVCHKIENINPSTFEVFMLPTPKRSNRITSLMFDNLNIINDLNME